jgi:hypothetical protein
MGAIISSKTQSFPIDLLILFGFGKTILQEAHEQSGEGLSAGKGIKST